MTPHENPGDSIPLSSGVILVAGRKWRGSRDDMAWQDLRGALLIDLQHRTDLAHY